MKDMELMRQMMEGLQQTEEWDCIWKEDPWIQAAVGRLDDAVDQIKASIPSELYHELWDALVEMGQASESASVLCGMRMACAFRAGLDHPEELSRYLMEQRPHPSGGAEWVN